MATSQRAVTAVSNAMHSSGLSEKELAGAMGISVAQLSHELHGEGHLALDRLDDAPHRFRAALVDELTVAWGVRSALDEVRAQLAEIRRVLQG